jgi:hypothetical protein
MGGVNTDTLNKTFSGEDIDVVRSYGTKSVVLRTSGDETGRGPSAARPSGAGGGCEVRRRLGAGWQSRPAGGPW